MGLLGVIIVRPSGFGPAPNRTAYGDADSAYIHEKLFLLTDMDIRVHDAVQKGNYTNIDFTTTATSTGLSTAGPSRHPFSCRCSLAQVSAYDALVLMNPGQTILYRMVNASRDPHLCILTATITT